MRKHRNPGAPGVNLGLIITPMLDMSFQILAFFIMTYHPSALEGHIAGSLAAGPVVGQLREPPAAVEPVPPLDDLGDVHTVIVKSSGVAPGRPDQVLLTSQTDPVPLQVADANVNWDTARRDLARQLQTLRKNAGDARADVRIEADAELRHEFVLEVYDVCKQAGYRGIRFVAPPIDRKEDRP
jgi:biopolymer transport protein ExbD